MRVTWIADLGAPRSWAFMKFEDFRCGSERSTSKELTRNSLPGVQM